MMILIGPRNPDLQRSILKIAVSSIERMNRVADRVVQQIGHFLFRGSDISWKRVGLL